MQSRSSAKKRKLGSGGTGAPSINKEAEERRNAALRLAMHRYLHDAQVTDAGADGRTLRSLSGASKNYYAATRRDLLPILKKRFANTKVAHEIAEHQVPLVYRHGNMPLRPYTIARTGAGEYAPLHTAARLGRVNVVRLLLEKGANVDARNDWGVTPLHQAATEGRVGVVRLLLEKGADVDARASFGVTPLLFAASRGHVDVVRLLLEKGADVNAREVVFGHTPLDMARRGDHRDIVALLERRQRNATR